MCSTLHKRFVRGTIIKPEAPSISSKSRTSEKENTLLRFILEKKEEDIKNENENQKKEEECLEPLQKKRKLDESSTVLSNHHIRMMEMLKTKKWRKPNSQLNHRFRDDRLDEAICFIIASN
mmetsp:Transcript_26810/g.33064  ORF Transcript_26810/g.33064 Transcript_26810/m.33064 type:complete len:121 (+) Transcript_26810:879-1241(+)